MTHNALHLGSLEHLCDPSPAPYKSLSYFYRPGNGFTYQVVVTRMAAAWLVSWYYTSDKGWQSFLVQEILDPLTYHELGDHLYRGKDFYVFMDYLPMLAFMGQISKRPVVMPEGWTDEGLNKDRKRRVWPPKSLLYIA